MDNENNNQEPFDFENEERQNYASNTLIQALQDQQPDDDDYDANGVITLNRATSILCRYPEFATMGRKSVKRLVIVTLKKRSSTGPLTSPDKPYIRYENKSVRYRLNHGAIHQPHVNVPIGAAVPEAGMNLPPQQGEAAHQDAAQPLVDDINAPNQQGGFAPLEVVQVPQAAELNVPLQQEDVANQGGVQLPTQPENQAPQVAEPHYGVPEVPPPELNVPHQGGGPPPAAAHAPPADDPNVIHQGGAQQEGVQPLRPAVPHQGEPQAHPAAAPGAFPHQGGNPPEDGAQPRPPAVHAQGEPQGAPQAPPAPGEAAINDHPPQPANENAVARHPDVQEHEDSTLLTLEVEPDGNLRLRDFPR